MNLENAIDTLRSQEETIIGVLIERAQLTTNQGAYRREQSEEGLHSSLLEQWLFQHERIEALFGRFLLPEEKSFHAPLPDPMLEVTVRPPSPELVGPENVNLTGEIRDRYLQLVPEICPRGDGQRYDLSIERDVIALKAISRRIHFGALYVAELKYREDPDTFDRAAREAAESGDRSGLEQMVTRADVESELVERVRIKAGQLQERTDGRIRRLVDPDEIAEFYEKTIVRLTKEGEILYLFNRPQ